MRAGQRCYNGGRGKVRGMLVNGQVVVSFFDGRRLQESYLRYEVSVEISRFMIRSLFRIIDRLQV
jgi:hypothetical protein